MNAFCRHLPGILAALLALVASGASAVAATAPAAKPAPAAPTIQQRIDALLKHRIRPEPLPLDPPNPFTVSTRGSREGILSDTGSKPAVTVDVTHAGAAAAPAVPQFAAASSTEILTACAVRLKIGGMIRLKDQVQLVVNDVTRKEGDFITVPWNNGTIQIRIVRLLPGQLVLRYEDAEVTLKF